jgi:pilus assembly protein CpaB
MSSRARTVALLGVSLVCAGIAASLVNGYAHDVRAQVGPLVPVVVARSPIARGEELRARNVPSLLAIRRVPARFAVPDALHRVSEAVGARALAPVPRGGYVGLAQLGPPAGETLDEVAAAGRVIEVPVAGATSIEPVARPGSLVDVLVTSDRGAGPPRTYIALQRVELVGLRLGDPDAAFGGGQGRNADGVATLRVGLRQAVMLTAAENFARELRLLPRGRGDRGRIGPVSVAATDLHQ